MMTETKDCVGKTKSLLRTLRLIQKPKCFLEQVASRHVERCLSNKPNSLFKAEIDAINYLITNNSFDFTNYSFLLSISFLTDKSLAKVPDKYFIDLINQYYDNKSLDNLSSNLSALQLLRYANLTNQTIPESLELSPQFIENSEKDSYTLSIIYYPKLSLKNRCACISYEEMKNKGFVYFLKNRTNREVLSLLFYKFAFITEEVYDFVCLEYPHLITKMNRIILITAPLNNNTCLLKRLLKKDNLKLPKKLNTRFKCFSSYYYIEPKLTYQFLECLVQNCNQPPPLNYFCKTDIQSAVLYLNKFKDQISYTFDQLNNISSIMLEALFCSEYFPKCISLIKSKQEETNILFHASWLISSYTRDNKPTINNAEAIFNKNLDFLFSTIKNISPDITWNNISIITRYSLPISYELVYKFLSTLSLESPSDLQTGIQLITLYNKYNSKKNADFEQALTQLQNIQQNSN